MERQLGKYISLNVVAMLGTSCYVLADTFFISVAQGADGITALNLILPIYGVIYAFGSMIGVGSATRYSLNQAMGSPQADDYFSNSVWWSLIFGGLFALFGFLFSEQLLILLGADAEILPIGLPYLRIVLWFSPFFILNYTFTAFVRNDGDPRTAMCATLFSGAFNIVFDYIFMFPMGMGMVGAALATGVSPLVSMAICMCHYLSGRNTIAFKRKRPSVRKLVAACNLGISAFVGEMSSGITTLIFNFILLGIAGNTAVAAYGIIANIALVGTALFNGISLGLQPVASAMQGSAQTDAQRRVYLRTLKIGAVVSAFLVVSCFVFSQQLVAVFNRDGAAELTGYAVSGLRLYFLGFLLAAVNIIKSGFCGAVGRGLEASVIALSRGVFTISITAFALAAVLGVTGVWLSFPVAELITWLLSVLLFTPSGRLRWKKV